MEKILVLTSTFPSFTKEDTAPPFIFELSKTISEIRNFKIVILAPFKKNSKTVEAKDGLKIYRFKYGFFSLCDGAILPNLRKNKLLWLQVPFFFFFQLLNLIKIIRTEKINIIHAHWIIPQGLIACFYKKFINNKIKIICTTHGSDILCLQGRTAKLLKKFVLNNINILTVVSMALKNEINKINIKKYLPVHVLPMGVNQKLFNPDKYDINIKKQYDITGPFILFVGRLIPEKGLQYLIDIMPNVIRRFKDAKLVIIGIGPLEKKLKQQVKKLQLSEYILFLGFKEHKELPKYFATADLFIGPSLSEGFGLVFVEALLSKTCVIVSNLLSISEVVINNKTGLQVDVKDEGTFSDCVIKLLENSELRHNLAEAGHSYARDHFSWSIISRQYHSLLKRLSR